MQQLRIEANGTVIPLSPWKTLLSAIWGILMLVLGAVAAIGGLWCTLAGLGLFGSPDNRIVVLLLGIILMFVGVLVIVAGAIVVFVESHAFVRRERYVIGEIALQRLHGHDEIKDHVPFDNIGRIEMGIGRLFNGNEYKFIGIGVIDPKRQDTILDRKERRRNKKAHGFDCAIMDSYELSLEDFYRKLAKRRKKAAQALSEEAEAPDEER